MRAAVMRHHELVVDTVPDPVPGPGEVLVRTLACGICGSDLHALKHAAKVVDAARDSGVPFEMDLERDIVMGINKELALQFVLGYTPEEFAAALDAIAGGHIAVTPLITGRVGIAGVPEAFAELARHDAHAKILVVPWR